MSNSSQNQKDDEGDLIYLLVLILPKKRQHVSNVTVYRLMNPVALIKCFVLCEFHTCTELIQRLIEYYSKLLLQVAFKGYKDITLNPMFRINLKGCFKKF